MTIGVLVCSVFNDLSGISCRPGASGSSSVVVGETSLKRRILIATPWFATSLAFAIFIPNIGEVIRFLGSLAAVFIFIFPGICLFQVRNKIF